jgi:hypothetical protein
MDTIAETLNAEGVAPRSGAAWYGSSVRNILNVPAQCPVSRGGCLSFHFAHHPSDASRAAVLNTRGIAARAGRGRQFR